MIELLQHAPFVCRADSIKMMHNICIRVAFEYHMLEALVDNLGEPTSTDEIAKRTGSDPLLVSELSSRQDFQ